MSESVRDSLPSDGKSSAILIDSLIDSLLYFSLRLEISIMGSGIICVHPIEQKSLKYER